MGEGCKDHVTEALLYLEHQNSIQGKRGEKRPKEICTSMLKQLRSGARKSKINVQVCLELMHGHSRGAGILKRHVKMTNLLVIC